VEGQGELPALCPRKVPQGVRIKAKVEVEINCKLLLVTCIQASLTEYYESLVTLTPAETSVLITVPPSGWLATDKGLAGLPSHTE
jgi:hypothetical protein